MAGVELAAAYISLVPSAKNVGRKIASELGYAPAVPFEQGLADTVAWYRDHRSWWEPLKQRAGLGS